MNESDVPLKFCLLIISSCCGDVETVLVWASARDEARPPGPVLTWPEHIKCHPAHGGTHSRASALERAERPRAPPPRHAGAESPSEPQPCIGTPQRRNACGPSPHAPWAPPAPHAPRADGHVHGSVSNSHRKRRPDACASHPAKAGPPHEPVAQTARLPSTWVNPWRAAPTPEKGRRRAEALHRHVCE